MKKKIALIVVSLETEEEDGFVEDCVLDQKALELTDEDLSFILKKAPQSEKLTAREKEVLYSMLKGRRRAETASDLFISEATVKKHSAAIYEKFGVKDRFELLSKLYRSQKETNDRKESEHSH